MTMPAVDLELKKALIELRSKMVETNKKILFIDSQISMLNGLERLTNVTQSELDKLPPGTNTYETIGRMYMLTPLEDVKANLQTRDTELKTKKTELQEKKKYLEENLTESENNIREMVQQRKEQTEVKSK